MTLSEWLGSRLRVERLNRIMTTAQVAAFAGMSRTTYEKLERGDDSVSLAKVQSAMEVLFLDVSSLCALQPAAMPSRRRVHRRAPKRPSKPLASREAETEAIRAVAKLVKDGSNTNLSVSGVSASDVAALLALVGETKTGHWHAEFKRVAETIGGDPKKAIKRFSVHRLLERLKEFAPS